MSFESEQKRHLSEGLFIVKMRIQICIICLLFTSRGFCSLSTEAAKADSATDWYIFEPTNDNGSSAIGMEDWIEAPAGTHGGVRVVGDRFEFEDGTHVKFWGVNNGNSNYLENRRPRSREQLEQFAKHYRKYGVNCARQHKFAENTGGILGDSVLEFVPEKLDALDYYLHQLREHGIYYGFSHVFHLRLGPKDRDKVLAFDEIGTTTGLKFARDIQDLHIEQTVRLLEHRNPYTGMKYADDPALAFVEMHNEDNLYWPNVQAKIDSAPTYKKLICRMFSDWLRNKYGDHNGLAKAWGEQAMNIDKAQQDEQLEKENIYPVANCFSLNWWLENKPFARQRALDTARFLYDVQVGFYKRYEKAIRETGYKGPLVGSCWQAGDGVQHYYNLHSDYLVGIIDRHNYWGGKKTAGQTMLKKPGIGLLGVGLQQVVDRPFAFSEWISVFPNEWAAECAPIVAAYGMGLQDWDASYEFYSAQGAFHHDSLGRTWCVQTATQIGLYPALARMVYRGDVRPGPIVSVRNVHVPGLVETDDLGFEEKVRQDGDFKEFVGGFQPGLAAGRVVVDFTDEPKATAKFDVSRHQHKQTITSATGQLVWGNRDDRGYFTIDTDGTKAFVGFASGKMFPLGPVIIQPHSLFCVVFVTATEKGKSVGESKRLIVTAVARIKNTGMKFNEDRTALLDKGKAPILVESVRATVTFTRNDKYTVHVLDHDGRRTGRTLPAPFERNRSFEIDGARDKTMYYEIVYE